MAEKALKQTEIAKRLGLTTRQVRNLVDAGMPVHGDGRGRYYHWDEVFRWYLDYKVGSAVERVTPTTESEAKLRKLSAEAELEELKLAELRGDLIRVDDAAREADAVFDRVRARLVAIPTKEAHKVVGLTKTAEAVTVMREIVDGALAELPEAA